MLGGLGSLLGGGSGAATGGFHQLTTGAKVINVGGGAGTLDGLLDLATRINGPTVNGGIPVDGIQYTSGGFSFAGGSGALVIGIAAVGALLLFKKGRK